MITFKVNKETMLDDIITFKIKLNSVLDDYINYQSIFLFHINEFTVFKKSVFT